MKRYALITILLFLGGCGSDGSSDYALYYQSLKKSVAVTFGHNDRITREQAAAIPYATIGYRLNDGPEQLLVLATDNGEEQLWTSGGHVVIVTRGGRIVRTVGLEQDVSAVTSGGGQFGPTEAQGGKSTSTRLEDFTSIPAYGVAVKCTVLTKGLETIVILGQGITTRKVDEMCRSEALGWSFTDTYWTDPTKALVWRSIQHVGPNGEKIEIETLRPPG